jgi:ketosteroid isomerase-like protein
MKPTFPALALALLAATAALPAQALAQADVVKPAHTFVDAFNKGDVDGAVAACADAVAIVDEFSPFVWHGPGACATWMKDYDADATRRGITDGVVTLGTPLHVDVDGDRAYLVIPSTYAFKLKGKAVKETGSLFTFALLKGPGGWSIVGWSWAKNKGPA